MKKRLKNHLYNIYYIYFCFIWHNFNYTHKIFCHNYRFIFIIKTQSWTIIVFLWPFDILFWYSNFEWTQFFFSHLRINCRRRKSIKSYDANISLWKYLELYNKVYCVIYFKIYMWLHHKKMWFFRNPTWLNWTLTKGYVHFD